MVARKNEAPASDIRWGDTWIWFGSTGETSNEITSFITVESARNGLWRVGEHNFLGGYEWYEPGEIEWRSSYIEVEAPSARLAATKGIAAMQRRDADEMIEGTTADLIQASFLPPRGMTVKRWKKDLRSNPGDLGEILDEIDPNPCRCANPCGCGGSCGGGKDVLLELAEVGSNRPIWVGSIQELLDGQTWTPEEIETLSLLDDPRVKGIYFQSGDKPMMVLRRATGMTANPLRKLPKLSRPMRNPGFPSMTQAEVRKISADLKKSGHSLPKCGYCVALGDGREICRDPNGYYIVGSAKRNNPDLDDRAVARRLARGEHR